MTGQLLSDMATPTVAPRRLHEQVLDSLVARIVAGEFPANTSLPFEAEMCEVYGVSRSSIREALRVLAGKGLIEVRHGLGTRVNPAECWDFMDALVLSARRKYGAMASFFSELHETRQIVECEVAGLAALRAREEDRETLRAAIEQMRRSVDDATAFAEANFTFHRSLMDATRNRVLQRIAAPIRELLEYTIAVMTEVPGNLDRTLDDHEKIYRAVCDRDAEAATRAMREHLMRAREEIARLSGLST